jgi:hypothetical protein
MPERPLQKQQPRPMLTPVQEVKQQRQQPLEAVRPQPLQSRGLSPTPSDSIELQLLPTAPPRLGLPPHHITTSAPAIDANTAAAGKLRDSGKESDSPLPDAEHLHAALPVVSSAAKVDAAQRRAATRLQAVVRGFLHRRRIAVGTVAGKMGC